MCWKIIADLPTQVGWWGKQEVTEEGMGEWNGAGNVQDGEAMGQIRPGKGGGWLQWQLLNLNLLPSPDPVAQVHTDLIL